MTSPYPYATADNRADNARTNAQRAQCQHSCDGQKPPLLPMKMPGSTHRHLHGVRGTHPCHRPSLRRASCWHMQRATCRCGRHLRGVRNTRPCRHPSLRRASCWCMPGLILPPPRRGHHLCGVRGVHPYCCPFLRRASLRQRQWRRRRHSGNTTTNHRRRSAAGAVAATTMAAERHHLLRRCCHLQ